MGRKGEFVGKGGAPSLLEADNDVHEQEIVMATMTLQLPDPTEARLRRQAEAAGKPVEQFVTEVLEAQASPSRILREIGGSARPRFVASGMRGEGMAERAGQGS